MTPPVQTFRPVIVFALLGLAGSLLPLRAAGQPADTPSVRLAPGGHSAPVTLRSDSGRIAGAFTLLAPTEPSYERTNCSIDYLPRSLELLNGEPSSSHSRVDNPRFTSSLQLLVALVRDSAAPPQDSIVLRCGGGATVANRWRFVIPVQQTRAAGRPPEGPIGPTGPQPAGPVQGSEPARISMWWWIVAGVLALAGAARWQRRRLTALWERIVLGDGSRTGKNASTGGGGSGVHDTPDIQKGRLLTPTPASKEPVGAPAGPATALPAQPVGSSVSVPNLNASLGYEEVAAPPVAIKAPGTDGGSPDLDRLALVTEIAARVVDQVVERLPSVFREMTLTHGLDGEIVHQLDRLLEERIAVPLRHQVETSVKELRQDLRKTSINLTPPEANVPEVDREAAAASAKTPGDRPPPAVGDRGADRGLAPESDAREGGTREEEGVVQYLRKLGDSERRDAVAKRLREVTEHLERARSCLALAPSAAPGSWESSQAKGRLDVRLERLDARVRLIQAHLADARWLFTAPLDVNLVGAAELEERLRAGIRNMDRELRDPARIYGEEFIAIAEEAGTWLSTLNLAGRTREKPEWLPGLAAALGWKEFPEAGVHQQIPFVPDRHEMRGGSPAGQVFVVAPGYEFKHGVVLRALVSTTTGPVGGSVTAAGVAAGDHPA